MAPTRILLPSPTGMTDHLGETVALGKKTVAITEIAKYLKTKGLACRRHEYRGNHNR
ncbi:MAG: hypothetical protein MZU97_03055 [Bacillus subtilis]|nr:hypothetical protein [Bacillus subtilis]